MRKQRTSIVAYCTARIVVQPDGCWLWAGSIRPNGYGVVKGGGRADQYAHRVLWEITVGPIELGHDIHHKYQAKACVNPAHLESLPHAQHVGRDSRVTWHARPYGPHVGVCANGHVGEYKVHSGRRWPECNGCKRDKQRQRRLSRG
jgi:hypothetical protein